MSSLADLKPDQNNARKHNPRNIGMVANSLREVGAARSGVIDEHGNILAGNGTYEALSEAGIEKVKIVQADGNEWVVVQRTGLSEQQKLKLALYDNRSAELAEWDKEVLADIDPAIMESMFSTDELEDLLGDVGGGELEDEDSVPEAPEKAISQLGDLYQLGQHRLLCGDSTAKDAVDKLMDGQKADICFTSPPYNANAKTGDGDIFNTKKAKKMYADGYSDNLNSDAYMEFVGSVLDICFENTDGFIFWNVSYNANSKHEYIGQILKKLDYLVDQVCWKKSSTIPFKGSMMRDWEPIYVFSSNKSSLNLKSVVSNFWEISNTNAQQENHKACFPVALPEKGIALVPAVTRVVYDPFGGSGSTMIASEKLNRKCYMMELDPQYCDVIVKRFNDLFPEIEILRNGEAFEPVC